MGYSIIRKKSIAMRITSITTALLITTLTLPAVPVEEDYYKLLRIPIPEGIVLEAGGIEVMPDGRVAVGTRRGDIYMVENAFDEDTSKARFSLWAEGLHEVLGLSLYKDSLYVTQRPEVSRLKDLDKDGRADLFETISDGWDISGDYHEYAFGSKFDPEGNMWVVLCLTGSFSSKTPYRGWCVRVSHDGKFIPTASGIRSPGGIGMNCAGEVFYCDNQGPWNGTSSLKHLTPGSFQGHPGGFKWYELDDVRKAVGERVEQPQDGGRFHKEISRIPAYRPPAILLPHGKVGNSASGITCDASGGRFGPFQGQLFVSDQTHSVINRCFLEKINGYYQGACFPFRKGFGSGNVPLMQCPDGSLYSGGTDRGWGARGGNRHALDRLVWTGKTPFEVHEMRIKPDGFELTFTEPVDPKAAADLASYTIGTYTYIFQGKYGSPQIDASTPTIQSAKVAGDGRSVRLVVDGLQIGHIHELKMAGIKSKAEGNPLLHDVAYYTLWHLPKG